MLLKPSIIQKIWPLDYSEMHFPLLYFYVTLWTKFYFKSVENSKQPFTFFTHSKL